MQLIRQDKPRRRPWKDLEHQVSRTGTRTLNQGAEYPEKFRKSSLALEGSVPRTRPDEKGEGAAKTNSSQSHPLNLRLGGGSSVPAGAEETLPHSKGCDSLSDVGARPPRPPSWGHGGPGQGKFSNTPTDHPPSPRLLNVIQPAAAVHWI